jgi:hypothetical protein
VTTPLTVRTRNVAVKRRKAEVRAIAVAGRRLEQALRAPGEAPTSAVALSTFGPFLSTEFLASLAVIERKDNKRIQGPTRGPMAEF